jgi:transposase
MEACASAHHWGRALIELGHEVRLLPPAHVKPYVRRNKRDQVDAAAIYEAMSRPGQRFVPVRSIENQAELMRHRARELLAGQRTAALNALRGHLAKIGVVAPQGAQHAYAWPSACAPFLSASLSTCRIHHMAAPSRFPQTGVVSCRLRHAKRWQTDPSLVWRS